MIAPATWCARSLFHAVVGFATATRVPGGRCSDSPGSYRVEARGASAGRRSCGRPFRSSTSSTRPAPTAFTGTRANRSSTSCTGSTTRDAFDHRARSLVRAADARPFPSVRDLPLGGPALRHLRLLLRRRLALRDAVVAHRAAVAKARRPADRRLPLRRGRASDLDDAGSSGRWNAYSRHPAPARRTPTRPRCGRDSGRSAAGPTRCSAVPISSRISRGSTACSAIRSTPRGVRGCAPTAVDEVVTIVHAPEPSALQRHALSRSTPSRRFARRGFRSSSTSSRAFRTRRREPLRAADSIVADQFLDRRVRALRDRGDGARQAGRLLPQRPLRGRTIRVGRVPDRECESRTSWSTRYGALVLDRGFGRSSGARGPAYVEAALAARASARTWTRSTGDLVSPPCDPCPPLPDGVGGIPRGSPAPSASSGSTASRVVSSSPVRLRRRMLSCDRPATGRLRFRARRRVDWLMRARPTSTSCTSTSAARLRLPQFRLLDLPLLRAAGNAIVVSPSRETTSPGRRSEPGHRAVAGARGPAILQPRVDGRRRTRAGVQPLRRRDLLPQP